MAHYGQPDLIFYIITVSYCYDELTIIYSCISISYGDILYGDRPNDGEYYPEHLKRFGVECKVENSLTSEDITEIALRKAE